MLYLEICNVKNKWENVIYNKYLGYKKIEVQRKYFILEKFNGLKKKIVYFKGQKSVIIELIKLNLYMQFSLF